MKYQESSISARGDLGINLKKVVNDLLAGKLVVEGQTVEIPEDQDVDIKVKYSSDEEGGNVTIKVGWDFAVEEVADEGEAF